MTLLDHGWTEEQAQGLLDSLKLGSPIPLWKPVWLQRLRVWCSAHEKNPHNIECQLDFIAYELRNSYQGVGAALDQAKTVEEASQAVELFMNLLRDEG